MGSHTWHTLIRPITVDLDIGLLQISAKYGISLKYIDCNKVSCSHTMVLCDKICYYIQIQYQHHKMIRQVLKTQPFDTAFEEQRGQTCKWGTVAFSHS